MKRQKKRVQLSQQETVSLGNDLDLPFSGEHVARHGERSVGNSRHIPGHRSNPWRVGAPGHQQVHPKDVPGHQPV